jgi:hypothetical protein
MESGGFEGYEKSRRLAVELIVSKKYFTEVSLKQVEHLMIQLFFVQKHSIASTGIPVILVKLEL